MDSPQRDIATEENADLEMSSNRSSQPTADVAPPAYDNVHASVGNNELRLCPNPPYLTEKEVKEQGSWYARLIFKTDNVPQLMREGLHWSLENVRWEDGYIEATPAESDRTPPDKEQIKYCNKLGLIKTRHYFLCDLQVPSQWVAHLQVYAAKNRVLANMRLGNLSRKNIYAAYAGCVDREQYIYLYDSFRPETWYNAIYDDMPMRGWWPWPKKKKRSQT
ncbi:uncharacterized protein F4807DRAFT_460009 [Annulohypoxylon truncatum]|uniref:uncharacterized protein n=1 Tax=Annulohypoxylon truncatum TaxID=327061 RepID=UPI0020089E42|nr:uncharacterized protein F4807DRAFT_460009 [Annulohypoxylon truncatum]KAI1210178.1 hypothetical protein F4807DRAFT_460009 [Annulohypoxylon truncatum]